MAAKPVYFHEHADAEYEQALDWYLARSPHAASDFADELSRAVEMIAGAPPTVDSRSAWHTPVSSSAFSVCLDLPRTALRHSSSCRCPLSSPPRLLDNTALKTEDGDKSAFRPCGRDLAEFFKSTGWAFLVNLIAPRPTSGWPVIRPESIVMSRLCGIDECVGHTECVRMRSVRFWSGQTLWREDDRCVT